MGSQNRCSKSTAPIVARCRLSGMRARVTTAVLGVILVGAMAACVDVDSSDDDAATTTTAVAADDTTTTNPDATTTTTPRGADLGEVPTFHDDGPSGSGC